MKIFFSVIQIIGAIAFIIPIVDPISVFGYGTALMMFGVALILGGGLGIRIEKKKLNEEKSLIKCPHCAEKIQAEAKICKHCNQTV